MCVYIYVPKIFPCRRDIKIPKLHPKQGRNKMLHALLEAKMVEVVVSPGKEDMFLEREWGPDPRGALPALAKSLDFVLHEAFAQRSNISSRTGAESRFRWDKHGNEEILLKATQCS